MNYNTAKLRSSFEAMKYEPSKQAVFFSEVEKFIRVAIHEIADIRKIYEGANNLFGGYYDEDDLVQDCILKVFELIEEKKLLDASGLTGYIGNVIKNVLMNYIRKESNRDYIVTITALDDNINVSYNDYHDFAEEDLSSIAKNVEAAAPKKTSGNKVYQVSKNYKKIAEFNTIEEAAAATGVPKSNISACCSHKRKSAGKYIWLNSNDDLTKLINFAA